MRTLIADDEAPARLKLRRLLARAEDAEIVGEARNGAEAVELIRALAPELVFLDIQMPLVDGLGVVEQVGPEEMPAVVFVTAHDEHAVRAFEVHALDYLLKPVTPERFRVTLARVRRHLSQGPDQDTGAAAERLRHLLGAAGRGAEYLERILVHDERRGVFLPVDRIDRIEADRNYVRLYGDGGATHEVRAALADVARRLDPRRFLRINKSEIVRIDAVREVHPWSHGDYRVVMRDGATLSWSRRYRAQGADPFGPRR
jgi:two-component system LytT family response regulator